MNNNINYFETSKGFILEASKETLENIRLEQHQQSLFFGEKMPKKADWHALRSWCKKRTDLVRLYLTNLELLEELLMNLVINEFEMAERKALPPHKETE